MNALEFFLRGHAVAHAPAVGAAEGQMSMEYNCLHGLTDEQLRLRPGGWNSIACLLWHTTRLEGVAVNVIVAEDRQVLDHGEWAPQLKIARP